jgi:hypothetical protein
MWFSGSVAVAPEISETALALHLHHSLIPRWGPSMSVFVPSRAALALHY